MRLILIGFGGHQGERALILRHRLDGAADEGVRQIELQHDQHDEREHAGNQHAIGQVDEAEAQRRADIAGIDVAVVDAEHQDQPDLGDEQDAEEEREAAQRLLSALLERQVVDLVDGRAERIEDRQHQQADQDRIEPEAAN